METVKNFNHDLINELLPKIENVTNLISDFLLTTNYEDYITEDYLEQSKDNLKQSRENHVKLLSFLILECFWLYFFLYKDQIPTKKESISKEKIIQDITNLKEKYGFRIFPTSLISNISTDLLWKIISTIKSIENFTLENNGIDVKGTIFQKLLPDHMRKITGSYHTRSDAAEILASLSVQNPNSKILDLSCGSGKLLVAAYRQLKNQNSSKPSKLMDQIYGIELLPVPASLSVLNLFLENPNLKDHINIGIANSLLLNPSSKFFPMKTNHSSNWCSLEKMDVVIMNPPFTRQENLDKSQKSQLKERFSKFGDIFDQRLGLHGYFILLADEFLKKDGVLGLVLPATVLRIESFLKLRKFLVNNYEIQFLIVSNESSSFSYESRFREILLVAKKKTDSKLKTSSKVRIAFLKQKPMLGINVKNIISILQDSNIKTNPFLEIIDVHSDFFKNSYENLFKFISFRNPDIYNLYLKVFSKKDKLIKFSNYCKLINGNLIRGWETLRSKHPIQANFILRIKNLTDSKSPWYVIKINKEKITICNKNTSKNLEIPKSCIQYGLRSLNNIDSINVNKKLDYIANKKFSGIENFLSPAIVENFPEWERILNRKKSRLAFVRRFNIGGKKFKTAAIVSNSEFTPIQTMSIVTNISLEHAKILSMWLNSSFHILQMIMERVETEGSYMELPEWAMKNLYVFDPLKLTPNEKKKLLNLYESIKDQRFPSLVDQLKSGFEPRLKIDEFFQEILKLEKYPVPNLHKMLLKEIEELKSLVKPND